MIIEKDTQKTLFINEELKLLVSEEDYEDFINKPLF